MTLTLTHQKTTVYSVQGLRTSAFAHVCDEDSAHLGQFVAGIAGLADVDRASVGEREPGSDDQAGSFAGRTFRFLSEWALVYWSHSSLYEILDIRTTDCRENAVGIAFDK